MLTQQNVLRLGMRNDLKLKVTVTDEEKVETDNEKLLGVIINNCLTWKNHLFGNDEELGLIKNLGK